MAGLAFTSYEAVINGVVYMFAKTRRTSCREAAMFGFEKAVINVLSSYGSGYAATIN